MRKVELFGEKLSVDEAWYNCRDSIGANGFDLAAYLSDGLSIWPCGMTVDINRDGGEEHCTCWLCRKIRNLMPEDWENGDDWDD